MNIQKVSKLAESIAAEINIIKVTYGQEIADDIMGNAKRRSRQSTMSLAEALDVEYQRHHINPNSIMFKKESAV